MIIRIMKRLTPSATTRLKTANQQTWKLSEELAPYCTSLYTLISKNMQEYKGASAIWFHPLVREKVGPYEQPSYQLKDLPTRDYSFKSAWEPSNENLTVPRESTLDNLFLELNFVQVVEDEEKGNGTDLSLTIMDEKHMGDTFVEHYAQLSFELFGNEAKKTLFSLANFFYNKPSLYKKTYEALVKNGKALIAFLPASLVEGYISLFSLEPEQQAPKAFKTSEKVAAKEMLFFRSSAYDLVRHGYEPLASFSTYGENQLECVQLQLKDNGLLAVDLMLKNSYLESEAASISSNNYQKFLENPKWETLLNKELDSWLAAIVLQANFAQALATRLKNIVLTENL